jgi:hypothetical protein
VRCKSVAAAACVAVASLVAAPAPASPGAGVRSCARGYSYAGYAGREGSSQVAATIAALSAPSVETGHAAAWVGVGGIHAGRGGKSEWLQAGLAAFPRTGLRLYVESVSRGRRRRFVDLGPAAVGRGYRFSVRETRADIWRAFVNGRAVGKPAYLPTAGGSWRPVVTAESWAAGRASCNRYVYRFGAVSVGIARAATIGAPVARARAGFSATA